MLWYVKNVLHESCVSAYIHLELREPLKLPPHHLPTTDTQLGANRHSLLLNFVLRPSSKKQTKRRGIEWSLISMLSPWLAVYLPIPLGLLDGIWSVHCAKLGHIRQHTTGSCASRGGLCGTAWGCSGPSCAVNLGEMCMRQCKVLLLSGPKGD